MKKTFAVALALLMVMSAALAENPYLSDWVSAYNVQAKEHGQAALDANDFAEVPGEGYSGVALDDKTVFMLGFTDNGSIYLCAIQARQGDARTAPMLACALCASAEDISYDKALQLFTGLLDKLDKGETEALEIQGNWYLIAGIESSEGGSDVVAAFSYVGIGDIAEDTEPGSIWDGLDPKGEEPTPKSTPKLEEGHYKI